MHNKNLVPGRKALNLFGLIMITIGSVDSIRNLPTIALFIPLSNQVQKSLMAGAIKG